MIFDNAYNSYELTATVLIPAHAMERLSLLLLSATAIAAIQICSTLAQSGGDGNDTSEEFSGSGMKELPTVTTPGQPSSCHIPVSSNLNRGCKNLTEEELEDVMMEGRCYLACTAHNDYMVTELL